MERQRRLEEVLLHIQKARLQLSLHPDVFEATEHLKIAEADLAALITEMFPKELSGG